MLATFFGTIGNFYKFGETIYDCEVAYQTWTLYHILFKYENRKRDFLFLMYLTEKTIGDVFMQLFKLK